MTSLLGASSELLVVATISLYQRLERLRLRLQSPLQLFFLGLTKDIVIQDPKSKQPKKGNAMETIVLILSRSFLKVRYSTSYTIQYHYYTLPTATNSNSPIVLLPLYLQSPLQFLFWVNQFYGQDPIMQILVIQKKELQWRLEVVTIYIYSTVLLLLLLLYYYYYCCYCYYCSCSCCCSYYYYYYYCFCCFCCSCCCYCLCYSYHVHNYTVHCISCSLQKMYSIVLAAVLYIVYSFVVVLK